MSSAGTLPAGGNVLFMHLDLGIGGAERWVVDSAVALQMRGYKTAILTSFHDRSRCFPETRDGTLRVIARGQWLPRSCFGKFYLVLSWLRMLYLTLLFLCKRISVERPSIIVVDQVSFVVPILRWAGYCIVFYCHFPDMLLADHSSRMKRVYRRPLDALEEWSTAKADILLVNSNFTKHVVRRTFTSLKKRNVIVLHPCINPAAVRLSGSSATVTPSVSELQNKTLFVSLNRFERKKNIMLAVEAFAELVEKVPVAARRKLHLVLAGGYDPRVDENRRVVMELQERCNAYGIEKQTTFLLSCSEADRMFLFEHATALLYTPENEHFGITPLEAMYCGSPVIACDSGGPLETVVHGETGFLVKPTKSAFSAAMLSLVNGDIDMSAAAKKHVAEKFLIDQYADKLVRILQQRGPVDDSSK